MGKQEETRKLIIESAFVLIYQNGFQGVGVREIAQKANLTIGAFFYHFPTKNHVGYAIIDDFLSKGIMDRWIVPLESFENPVEGIIQTFKKTFEEWPDEFVSRGCPLNNLGQEMSAIDPEFQKKAKGLLSHWIQNTKTYLDIAKKKKILKAKTDTMKLAEFIVTFQEATFAMGKVMNDRSVYDSLYLSFRDHLLSQCH
ncbi:TetR/AcrR family transcriptional regulator [Leptospira bandrabouensis]|uniref:TetR/AcrR family transcriptional regulator n=1 Tax=Leptospira bandrabouensis TaxID=2484903 RepID=A0A6H3NRM1_9LEPT|nr:TetR/AcrR family transcriptional regulator [Leptospira bandrabouensis]MCG6152276.1 TetR/AcrR family transcriptional regulator [Leptospira bandrabouensis]MCW7457736.1 TetR/AcrR family transcriptional regulator [Leptospira bandrabouensis]MCW7477524.1 TetR/AcrR family transcriptional regulator [Leptospira bandrabouensis]MCW7485206.1 TetR/AcrR family transcriptional regulator [Leptospira bandrabouensis]TGN07378.1 TetR/AcrR family transcriptional regulator [Leptospira bandrabouensis]